MPPNNSQKTPRELAAFDKTPAVFQSDGRDKKQRVAGLLPQLLNPIGGRRLNGCSKTRLAMQRS